jgi:hypothetical protein
MPRVFAGMVYVWPQKSAPPYIIAALEPTAGNFNQDVYLVLDCLFVFLAALYLRSNDKAADLIRTYFWSAVLVAGLALWQFASRTVGVPYPNDLFYSNPGMATLTTQSIGSIPRINGPFTEPSALAGYMVGIMCASGWAMMQGHRGGLLRWSFALAVLTIALSTSATGIAVALILVLGVPGVALVTGSVRLMASIIKIWLPAFLCVMILFTIATVFIPGLGDAAELIFSSTVNKQDSSSYEERTSADFDSLTAFVDSYGLGVGWGSNRSSSLIPGLLASLGIPGCVGLIWFGTVVTREVRKARRGHVTAEQLLAIDACTGAIIGFLLAAMLSGPTINAITFYFLLALLIATATRVTSKRAQQ